MDGFIPNIDIIYNWDGSGSLSNISVVIAIIAFIISLIAVFLVLFRPGIVGDTGERGPRGNIGMTGATGATGAMGESFYNIINVEVDESVIEIVNGDIIVIKENSPNNIQLITYEENQDIFFIIINEKTNDVNITGSNRIQINEILQGKTLINIIAHKENNIYVVNIYR